MQVSSHRNGSSRLCKIGEASKLVGMSPNSLRLLQAKGHLAGAVFTTPGRTRLYDVDKLKLAFGIYDEDQYQEAEENNKKAKVIIYARTSSNRQARGINKGNKDNDLARQIEKLQQAAKTRGAREEDTRLYQDVSSGMNWNRPGFGKLLNDVLSGKLEGHTLLLSHKERICRFGYELVESVFNAHGVAIEFTEADPNKTNEDELTEDLMAVLHHFSSKSYAARSIATNIRTIHPEIIERARKMYSSGKFTIQQIVDVFEKEGLKTIQDTPILYNNLRKKMYEGEDMHEVGKPQKGISSFIEWLGENDYPPVFVPG